MKRIEEKLLLYKIITKRDPDSYATLYDHYIEKIYRFVYFKVQNREDAEDLTSEVFLKAWQYMSQKSGLTIESLSGLLFSIARNSVIDFYRQRAKKPLVSLDVVLEVVAADQKEQDSVEHKEDVAAMIQLIQKLKQDYQEVLLLKYVEELKIKEIAKVLGKSAINVRVLLHRAVKKLKELYVQSSVTIPRNE